MQLAVPCDDFSSATCCHTQVLLPRLFCKRYAPLPVKAHAMLAVGADTRRREGRGCTAMHSRKSSSRSVRLRICVVLLLRLLRPVTVLAQRCDVAVPDTLPSQLKARLTCFPALACLRPHRCRSCRHTQRERLQLSLCARLGSWPGRGAARAVDSTSTARRTFLRRASCPDPRSAPAPQQTTTMTGRYFSASKAKQSVAQARPVRFERRTASKAFLCVTVAAPRRGPSRVCVLSLWLLRAPLSTAAARVRAGAQSARVRCILSRALTAPPPSLSS